MELKNKKINNLIKLCGGERRPGWINCRIGVINLLYVFVFFFGVDFVRHKSDKSLLNGGNNLSGFSFSVIYLMKICN